MSKLNPQTKRRIQLPDAAFFLAFVCLLAYFIFLAPYGWAGSDEAFYVAEPYRFVQGDCFFTDDWNCGQLFAFALIPLMKLRLALVCVLMLTAEKHPAADMYFAGVFVAVLVLNCPFAVAIYIIYALAVLVLTLMRKRGRVTGEGFGGCAFMPRSLMWSAFGAGTRGIITRSLTIPRR